MRGALKHQVLQVMRQARRLSGVILRSRPNGNICMNPRLLIVYRKINLQTIIQGVYACLGHITLHGLKLILLRLYVQSEHKQQAN